MTHYKYVVHNIWLVPFINDLHVSYMANPLDTLALSVLPKSILFMLQHLSEVWKGNNFLLFNSIAFLQISRMHFQTD